MMKIDIIKILILAFPLLSSTVFSSTMNKYLCIKSNEDTLWVVGKNNDTLKVKMSGITVPHKLQPSGKFVDSLIKDRCRNKEVYLNFSHVDSTGLMWTNVFTFRLNNEINGTTNNNKKLISLNFLLLKTGNAWPTSDCKLLNNVWYLESEKAMKEGVGIWSYPNPIHPDEWDTLPEAEKKRMWDEYNKHKNK